MDMDTVRFSRRDSANFFRTLNKRVNQYFKENNIKKTGNWKLHLKTVIMFAVFLTPYFVILTLNLPVWANLLLTILMGVGMAGV
ncbi:MAG: acyl-CoA desaturase, partial [Bacteroidota bacterium]